MPALAITIVGAGRLGSALGRRWSETGHKVVYGVRDPVDPKHLAVKDHAEVAATADAVVGADAILLAVPWSAAVSTVASLPDLGDAIVIDATNPLAGAVRHHDSRSGAEQIAAAARGGRVVKAFNTTGSANVADPSGYEPRPTMWLAGDDASACETVADLAAAIGFAPVLAGDASAAHDLEHLAALWIRLAHRLGHGPDIAISLQTKGA